MVEYMKRTTSEWEWARLAKFVGRFTIDPVTDCWSWDKPNKAGYGVYQEITAHRWAWLVFEGPIPEGMTLDHLCCNPRCVNTAHLEIVTNEENAGRALRRRMAWATIAQWMQEEPVFRNSAQFFMRG